MRRLCWITTFAVHTLAVSQALAVPPGAVITGSLPAARWVEHRVIPGERLQEIGERYRVDVAQILEWNSIDANNVMLRVGQQLRIWTASNAPERKRRSITVREGDSWEKIARRFDVGLEKLRKKWNPGLAEELQPGDQVKIWIEQEGTSAPSLQAQQQPQAQQAASTVSQQSLAATLEAVVTLPSAQPKPSAMAKPGASMQPKATMLAASSALPTSSAMPKPPEKPAATRSAKPVIELPTVAIASTTVMTKPAALPVARKPATPALTPAPSRGITFREVAVPTTGMSIGTPNRGRLRGGVQLPENPTVYTIRNPSHSFGTTHAVEQLQRALIAFRAQSGFDREILVCDMSQESGGRFRPHASHRSGRDVDIRLPLKAGIKTGTIPDLVSVVDWPVAWQMVKAILASGEVKYIFLSRSRQKPLYEAALKAGETPASLREFMQYPQSARGAILRHSSGHTKHFHVRWKCSANEAECVDP